MRERHGQTLQRVNIQEVVSPTSCHRRNEEEIRFLRVKSPVLRCHEELDENGLEGVCIVRNEARSVSMPPMTVGAAGPLNPVGSERESRRDMDMFEVSNNAPVLQHLGVELGPGVININKRSLARGALWRVLCCSHWPHHRTQPGSRGGFIARLHLQPLPLAAAQ